MSRKASNRSGTLRSSVQGPGAWNPAGGEVIVSVVLNLPTTGPLLLEALEMQDMYLAGSFIMILSALTVIGTVVSDLILAWSDPRIRYE